MIGKRGVGITLILIGLKVRTKCEISMVFCGKRVLSKCEKGRKCSKSRIAVPEFAFYGGVVVIVKRGCGDHRM